MTDSLQSSSGAGQPLKPALDPTTAVSAGVLGTGPGVTGVITIDRPRVLNALDHSMIRAVGVALDCFANNAEVAQVLIRSAVPKVFCSGGDVRSVRETDLTGDYSAGDAFFREEYDVNHALATFPKPVVALVDGIAMGGGLGLSMHASHRVITPKTWASMPEAAIGFVTDVGISHVFTHLPAQSTPDNPSLALGLWLAATAYRLNAGDLLWTGLATHLVEDAGPFTDALLTQGLDAALTSSVPASEYPESELSAQAERIIQLFADANLSAIEARLREGQRAGDSTAELTRTLLALANPLSVEAMAQLLTYSARHDLREALDAEFTVGSWARRQPNFSEGVRAVLVDKTQDAAFTPADIDGISGTDRQEISHALEAARQLSAERSASATFS